jgi:hypothetical protein
MGLPNTQCWICHNVMPRIHWCTWTSIIWVQNSWKSPRLSFCEMWLAGMQCLICHNEWYYICRRDSGAPRSGWILLFHSKYVRHFWLSVHLNLAPDDWFKHIAALCTSFNWCHLSCNTSARGTFNVVYQSTSSHMVINNKHEHQWNPTIVIVN